LDFVAPDFSPGIKVGINWQRTVGSEHLEMDRADGTPLTNYLRQGVETPCYNMNQAYGFLAELKLENGISLRFSGMNEKLENGISL
jgi:hypothetical protein